MGNLITKNRLKRKTLENTEQFKFDNEIKYCKVLDVYDGDTITVGIILDKKPFRIRVRMYGYDSPEMKPRLNLENRDKIKKDAIKARDILRDLILDKICKIKIEKGTWDKYGRLLGTIYMKTKNRLRTKYDFNVNEFMIQNNLGYRYYGGKKKN